MIKMEVSIDLYMIFYIAQTGADHSQLNDEETSRTHAHAPVHIYSSGRRKQLALTTSLIKSQANNQVIVVLWQAPRVI